MPASITRLIKGLLKRAPAEAAGPRSEHHLGEAGQWRLLEMVHTDPAVLWANLLTVASIGALCLTRNAAIWLITWAAGGLLISLIRIWDFYSFGRRRQVRGLRSTRARYILMAWLMAAHWSISSLSLLLTDDPTLRFWLMTSQAAYLAGSLARTSPILPAAIGANCLLLLPESVILTVGGDVAMQAYAMMVLFWLVATVKLARSLNERTVGLLFAEEENAKLLNSVREANGQLEIANARLLSIASTDALTGISNRRALDQMLQTEWLRCARNGGTISVLLLDIDHFKSYNDRFGHPAGDECLRRVADCVQSSIMRPGDCAARYGGEEFAVILPNTDLFGAMDTAERIRAAVQAMGIPAASGIHGVVTVSIGAAAANHPAHNSDRQILIDTADQHLYRAKHDSRNCVRAGMWPAHMVATDMAATDMAATDITATDITSDAKASS